MIRNPVRESEEAFRRQVVEYRLGDRAKMPVCPIYISFEAGERVPGQCRSCEGTREGCQTFKLYLDIRKVVQ
jgi:hypothetical protein